MTAIEAARARDRIVDLVGIAYRDPATIDESYLQAMRDGSLDLRSEGLDCVGLVFVAWQIIGEEFGDPARWLLPLPPAYPYDLAGRDGEWMPSDDARQWRRHFQPVGRPQFGVGVIFEEDHCGVVLGTTNRDLVVHSHRKTGVVKHELGRLAKHVNGYWLLRYRG